MTEEFDPRQLDDFRPGWLPLFDGEQPPPPGAELYIGWMNAFAAVYYQLNSASECLKEAREAGESDDAVAALLDELSALAIERHQLDRRLAREGFRIEPEIEGITCVNLVSVEEAVPVDPEAGAAESEPDGPEMEPFSGNISWPPEDGVDADEHLRGQLAQIIGVDFDEAPPAQRLILWSFQSPGDIVMLTAAVRDLHECFPGEFQTDVRTSCPSLWENNPHITPLSEDEIDVQKIHCEYPQIHRSNQEPFHFIHGFMQDVSAKLGIPIRPTRFGGDLHLTEEEMASPGALLDGALPDDKPWWLVAAGGKLDFTIKWWSTQRYQEVVHRLRGRVHFVQVGEEGHHHPLLEGVIDLRGKTSLRELVRLTYHCHGVLCGVTLLMHLAAALPEVSGRARSRGGVIVAGGREPPHWEAYPRHQFLHTVGMLPCCASGGCWRARTLPLGDGEPHDEPKGLCLDVVNDLPHCMDMITAVEVASKIEGWLESGES